MIVVCEPQCLKMSHEKVNSGFLYGIRLAYPNEKILFYAADSHIRAIKHILIHDNVYLSNIEYKTIKFSVNDTLFSFVRYYLLFKKIFSIMKNSKIDKLFLLSFNIKILFIIQKLKQKPIYSTFKLAAVLHGEFENIADEPVVRRNIETNHATKDLSFLISKIKKVKASNIPYKILTVIIRHTIGYVQKKYLQFCKHIFSKLFPYKKIFTRQISSDYRFIALSPHIINNSKNYLDLDKISMKCIVMPTIFSNITEPANNEYVKFAVFGFGYPAMLQKVLMSLFSRTLYKNYEIRIIGMDNSGTEGFSNISSCPNTAAGYQLSREEMEQHVVDIDIFLNLYDKDQYRLSCTNSITEALSYIKPILHFDNDCINTFNNKEHPIGICCDTIDMYASKMADIINNFTKYKPCLAEYRQNISLLRNKYSLANKVSDLRDVYTW